MQDMLKNSENKFSGHVMRKIMKSSEKRFKKHEPFSTLVIKFRFGTAENSLPEFEAIHSMQDLPRRAVVEAILLGPIRKQLLVKTFRSK